MINFLRRLFGLGSASAGPSRAELTELNVCPNCWGKQQYEGQYQKALADATKSNLTGAARKTFIQQFVETHVSGISLKSEKDKVHCPKCNFRADRGATGGW